MNFHGYQEGYQFYITWKSVVEFSVKSKNDLTKLIYQKKKPKKLFNSYNADLLIAANAALIREVGSTNQSVTNVIYTNGGIDPWLYNGIVASGEPRTIALIIDSKKFGFARLRFSRRSFQ